MVLGETAAIDGQSDAGKEGSLVGAQEDGSVGDVCWSVKLIKPKLTRRLRDASQRNRREHLLLGRLAEEGALEARVAEDGADGVEALIISY